MAKAKYKQGKDGCWRTKVWDGTYNADNTKHRANLKSDKSSGDLEKKVNALRQRIADGVQIQSTDKLFCQYAKEWLKTYKAVRSNNTKAMYANIIEHHISALGTLKLSDVRRLHLQLLINNAIEKPRTCQQITITFKQIVQCAVDDKYLPATAVKDICDGVEKPRYKAAEKRALTPQEIKAIKSADFTPMEKTFVLILYGCGLRRGETLALKRIDVDLTRSVLTVRQAVEFIGNNPALKCTKSDNGRRCVPIPSFLREHLTAYIQTLSGDFLFQNILAGGLMTKSSYRRMWANIENKINLAAGGTNELRVVFGLTAHIFRHNYCANLCYQVPMISTKKIAELLGDTEAMVLNVYNHVIEEKEDVETVVQTAIVL